MTTTTAPRAAALPQPSPDEGREHAAAEYAALVAMVEAFSAEHWGLPTDCTAWRVRDMVAHLTGRGGGRWSIGEREPAAAVTEDAVAFMRLLSGRSDECVLASDGDPAVAGRLRAARVVF